MSLLATILNTFYAFYIILFLPMVDKFGAIRNVGNVILSLADNINTMTQRCANALNAAIGHYQIIA